MKKLFNQINQEISTSDSKFSHLKSDSIHDLSVKMSAFSEELKRLNKRLPELMNSHIKNHKLTDQEIKELKTFIDTSMTDFIANSGVPGINKNFRLDFDAENLKS
ncbi:MAG: hypothetical protein PF487_06025 [Bacteroidales bacterium]|jgi:uncharacterized radical SAM superfamily protein|nr:hypothetical protein [Bacteroidales bacterium]